MATVKQVVKLLETYRGRDKIMRSLTYLAMFLAGNRSSFFARNLRIILKELSNCRTILRLFDDLPMFLCNLQYGTGNKKDGMLLRVVDVISSIVNQLYYPVEHIAWLAEKGVLSRSSSSWWTACIALWAISLTFEIIRTLVRLNICRENQSKLVPQESGFENNEQNEEIAGLLRTLKQEEWGLVLTLLQSSVDLLNAGNWLPKGVLWSSTFSQAKSGLFGLISSGIMLYKMWPSSEKKHFL